jgi:hypothetical protein
MLPRLTQGISQVAALHLPHKPSGKGYLLLLGWHWFGVPKVLMVASCANSNLSPPDHETSLFSSPVVWVRLFAQLGYLSAGVLLMTLDGWCQNLHITLQTLLPWTECHCLCVPTWVLRLYRLLSHPVLWPNWMLIVCVHRNQISTHIIYKMDTD